ncbi:MAG: alkene reductase [Proteobacteria bacterium]|nr:alkene reductase [Pseudomonadota bacterium]
MESYDVFSPVTIGTLNLKNRLVMAPLTRNRAGEGNVPQDLNAKYYAQRANAGLIITEASQISAQGVGYPATPGIHSQAQVQGWKKVTRDVHEKGGLIIIQLWHVGRISHPSLQPGNAKPVAPSAIKPEGNAFTLQGLVPFETPRALETDEIPGIVDQYETASEMAMDAGFDGVEIHAANGYLLDQFIRDGSNHRKDQYGGILENRLRLLKEVTDTVTRALGADRVGVRISPENTFNDIKDSNPQATFNAVADMLRAYGLAYLHVVEGDFVTGKALLNYREIKDRFKGPYMANGGYDFERAQKSLKNKDADLISLGKLFLANPDLVNRFKKGAPLNTPDETTFYGGDAKGYTDYPTL